MVKREDESSDDARDRAPSKINAHGRAMARIPRNVWGAIAVDVQAESRQSSPGGGIFSLESVLPL
jgi:hypothetical protein